MTIPQSVEAITAEWISDVLAPLTGGRAPPITDLTKTLIGEDKGLLSQVVRVGLKMEGDSGALPATIVVKIEPQRAAFRAAVEHRSSFLREISFYREIAPRLPIRVPQVFHAEITPEAGVLVMEDLNYLTGYDQIAGLDHGRVLATVRTAARLHAAYWNQTASAEFAWVPDHEHFHDEGFQELWPAFAEAYGLRIGAEAVRLGEQVAGKLQWVRDQISARPTTLIHCDLRSDNLMFGERGSPDEVMIIDWQGINKSMATIDIARILGGSEPIAERQGRQMEIFEAWYESLCAAGITDYGRDEALHDLRLAVLYCIAIPVCVFKLAAGNPRGRLARLLDALAERHYASAIELDAGQLLE